MTRIDPRRIAPAVLVLALALALPLSVSAAGRAGAAATQSRHTGAAFAFGRVGGNIAPFTVTIARNGTVSSAGATPGSSLAPRVSLDGLDGLLRLARAEGFFSLPHVVVCRGSLPDFAGQFVTITTGGTTRKVTVRGGCRPGFTELYAVVSAVAGAVQA